MSSTGLDTFDTTVQETNHWLKIMMGEFGTDDRRTAFNALRAALHALRDRIGLVILSILAPNCRCCCAAPTMRAGIRRRRRHASGICGFVDHVAGELPRQTTINPGEAARACFATMERCLDRGELMNLRGSLPHEVLNLFPDSLVR